LPVNLIQLWLTQYDGGELNREEVEVWAAADYEAKIAALERKVGQLTTEVELLKKYLACNSPIRIRPPARSPRPVRSLR